MIAAAMHGRRHWPRRRSRPWLDLTLLAALAAVVLGLGPAGRGASLAAWPAVPAAAVAGAALGLVVTLLAGRRGGVAPGDPSSRRSPGAAATAVLLVASAGEEVVWRQGLQAWLATADGAGIGGVAALACTAALFGLAHPRPTYACLLHAATGASFGAAFLTGGLAASVAAHCAYNAAILATTRLGRRPWAAAAPSPPGHAAVAEQVG